MEKDKKRNTKSQTKAGMMEKNSNRTENKKDKSTSEKKPENTPKMSKENAEGHHDDKPIH